MGKRCQVLGLPSLACPWHWEGLMSGARATDSAPFLLPGRGNGSSMAPPRGTKVGVGEATLYSEDEA